MDKEYWRLHINGLILDRYEAFLFGIVLDLACGDGCMTELIAEREGVTRVIGVDNDLAKVEAARKRIDDKKGNILHSDITTFEFEGLANTIVSFHTLEHIEPDWVVATVERFWLNLRPGGVVIVSVPYRNAYANADHKSSFEVGDVSLLFDFVGFEELECYRDQTVDGYGNQHDCITGLFRKGIEDRC